MNSRLRHLAKSVMALAAIAILGLGGGVSYATNIDKIDVKAAPSAAPALAATQSEVGKVLVTAAAVTLHSGAKDKRLVVDARAPKPELAMFAANEPALITVADVTTAKPAHGQFAMTSSVNISTGAAGTFTT